MTIRYMLMALLLLITPAVAANAQAPDRKVALIIANGVYASATQLTNPKNDAALIAASARKAGFVTVTLVQDLSLTAFQRALRDFRDQANGAQVAMVYYAGHGIEGSGKNWLIPVDAQLKSDLDLPYEAIDLDRVLESISGAQVRMVVLDACRNNPFGRSWRSSSRAVARGLGGIEIDDVLVIYAAAPGQTASDGDGNNSPFATSLAKRIGQPDLPIQLLGGAVRDDVLAATGGGQRPFVSASITGTPVYLVPRSAASAPQTVASPATAPTIDTATLDALAWQGALGAQSVEGYQEYKAQFPQGRFVKLAEQNIARLNQPAPEAATSIPTTKGGGVFAKRPAAANVFSGLNARNQSAQSGGTAGGTGRNLPPPAIIFPQSSTQRLKFADLRDLVPVQLSLARNEIFARHGFIFNSPELRSYFSRFDWYTPVGREVKLNPVEQANVKLLQQAERQRGAAD